MSYDHSLSATVRLKEGVTDEQVCEAIQPLTQYFGLDPENALGALGFRDMEFGIEVGHDGARYLHIYTSGDVGDGFTVDVAKTATNLGALAQTANVFVLKNFDTAKLENAINNIPFGPSQEEIDAMLRDNALNEAMALLGYHLDEKGQRLVRELAVRLMKSKLDVEPVGYWDCEQYSRENVSLPGKTKYLMEVDDQRLTNGQLRVVLAAEDGNGTDYLDAYIEVNRFKHDSKHDDLPCLHLAFDNDNLAASFFKQGDRFIMRPEAGVSVHAEVVEGEYVWAIE